MTRIFGAARTVLALSFLPVLGGCWAATGAAGAAGAIAYTDRGAESHVDASVAELDEAAQAVFSEMGVTEVTREVETDGTINLDGKLGDEDVHVEIEREEDPTTHIEVTVKENAVDYDKSQAKEILDRIILRV